MEIVLNNNNVWEYLKNNILDFQELDLVNIKLVNGKNFNLLITLSNNEKILVKQSKNWLNREAHEGLSRRFKNQFFLEVFPDLEHLKQDVNSPIHIDYSNLIIVFKYLEDYQDLIYFYETERNSHIKIAIEVGRVLGKIHSSTFKDKKYQEFFGNDENAEIKQIITRLEVVEPEIFGQIPTEGIKFFTIYQKSNALRQSLKQLYEEAVECCLVHKDMKLNNILLRNNWIDGDGNTIKIIDWENCGWGDPAFDLGLLIGDYIRIWLNSLVISKSLPLVESLRLAVIPLETLQPSMGAIVQSYLNVFPDILDGYPNFIQKVIQYAGFGLIKQILATIQYEKHFGNNHVAMLEVATTLLSKPNQSISTIFGTAEVK
jgi:hypothetical protein